MLESVNPTQGAQANNDMLLASTATAIPRVIMNSLVMTVGMTLNLPAYTSGVKLFGSVISIPPAVALSLLAVIVANAASYTATVRLVPVPLIVYNPEIASLPTATD